MRTYVSTPAFFAAVASSKFRSRSIFRWLATPPAAERVVPRPERNMDFEGEAGREGNKDAHVEVSVEWSSWSFEVGEERRELWILRRV